MKLLFLPSPASTPQSTYLLGLRGFLITQTFLWTFLQTFVPATVKSNIVTFPPDTPTYQNFIRKILSPIFWNESLIYSSFIFLSARTLCISFISSPTKQTITSSIFRRSFRLIIPTIFSLSLITLLSHITSTDHFTTLFITRTANASIQTPSALSSPVPLTLFNSIFTLFLSTSHTPLHKLSAVRAFPSATLSILPILYSQSYTLYITTLIIPYTRPLWRLKYSPLFLFTAYWVSSYSFISISGLLLTDFFLLPNSPLLLHSKTGFPLPKQLTKKRVPSWMPYTLILLIGIGLQYFYITSNSEVKTANAELKAHTDIYGSSGGLNTTPDLKEQTPRIADWLILCGGFLLLETRKGVQNLFKNTVMIALGKRSLSYFLTQSIVVYSAAIPLYLHLVVDKDVSDIAATCICFVISVLGTLVCGEVFYRGVEIPSLWAGVCSWGWMRK
ncbi:8d9f3990-add8-4178-8149-cf3797e2eb55 [Sclerotinia trifoliorum]|uniref:8d9f3990-add8-4178-8149-cf3797e2eb55 n=1 Tax=Sclerotinia trifoliorum TaxID=28548 RepID=A0A8H2VPV5_9HELO|nr:8d9f3990-add8-4178-8149-cf3797e2eb55 [Sclerotinia trifoliorum]